jgi:hypothetical protein
MGWFVHDYRGLQVLSHGGTLSGTRAQCFLVPEKKLGVFAVCNLRPTYFPETACRIVVDRLLNLPEEDWLQFAKKQTAAIDERVENEAKKRAEERKKDTKPTLALKEYAGVYQEPAYGLADVRLEMDQLYVKWGLLEFRLDHYHHDRFTAVLVGPKERLATADRSIYEANFLLNPNQEVVGVTLFGQGFARMPVPKKPRDKNGS